MSQRSLDGVILVAGFVLAGALGSWIGLSIQEPAASEELPRDCVAAIVAADEIVSQVEADHETASAEVSAVQAALERTSYRDRASGCGVKLKVG